MQTRNFARRVTVLQYSLGLGMLALAACGGGDLLDQQPSKVTTIQQPDISYPISEHVERLSRNGRLDDVVLHRWLDYRQIDRIAYEDNFRFPNFRHNGGDSYTETRVPPPLDILIVVDDSGSMSEEQANLAARLGPLLTYVQGSDWQIHIVTTTTSCPTPMAHTMTIKKGDADPAAAFATAVNAGTGGDVTERGIKMAREGLEKPCNNVMWLRANSTLAVLIITDEDNCSAAGGCASEGAWDKADYLYDYLAQIRQPGATARVYGILWHPSQATCNTASSKGTVYADVISRTQGIWGSICDTDFTPTLLRISKDAASLLPPTVSLSQIPASGTVVVKIDGQVLPPSAYRIQGKDLYLNAPMATGSRLDVTYGYDDPYNKIFPLTHPAAPDSVLVESSGTPFPAGDFAYNAFSAEVTIIAAALPNQQIKVKYKENKPLKTVFFTGPVQDPTTVKCFLADGTELHGFTYDASRQSVVFTKPPTEMQLFKCSFDR